MRLVERQHEMLEHPCPDVRLVRIFWRELVNDHERFREAIAPDGDVAAQRSPLDVDGPERTARVTDHLRRTIENASRSARDGGMPIAPDDWVSRGRR